MEPVTIRTKRLTLELCSVAHLESVWTAIEASRPELRQWMPWGDVTESDERAFLERAESAWRKDEGFLFLMFSDDAVAGGLSVNLDRQFSAGTIGYWIRSDLAGQGLVTEAATALVDWSFETLTLHRLELRAGIGNHGSIRVAEKLGFTRVGTLRQASRGVSGWHDCYVYDLLRDEWSRPHV